jgi:hypothetical protein
MAFTDGALAGAHSCSLLILVMCLVVVAAVTTPSDYSPSVNPRATSTPKPDDQTRVDSRDVATSMRKLGNILNAAYEGEYKYEKEDWENVPDFQMLGFFLESKLVKGSTMNLGANFLYDAADSRRDFLPGAVADTLPALKASNLPKLLQAFNIREGTEMASSMETTISLCERIANLTPEAKPASCPTSEKAMAKFVSSLLGQNVELLTSTVISAKASAVSDPVTVVDYHTRSADIEATPVVCHSLSFPSQVYYCHKLSKTRVLQATLEAAEGGRINAVVICHLDTSWWSPKHPAFAALNVQPGAEVCHWASESTLVWVRNSNT